MFELEIVGEATKVVELPESVVQLLLDRGASIAAADDDTRADMLVATSAEETVDGDDDMIPFAELKTPDGYEFKVNGVVVSSKEAGSYLEKGLGSIITDRLREVVAQGKVV